MNEKQKYTEQEIKAQETFLGLPEDFKNKLIENAHENANKLKALVNSGKAKNYEEAAAMLPSSFAEYPEMDIEFETIEHGTVLVKTESNGDYFLYFGNNDPVFLGNADEGVYSELSGILHIDTKRQDENLSGIFAKLEVFKQSAGRA